MLINKRLVLAAAVAGSTALTSFSADAFFGPFNFMRGWGGGPWGWGGYPYWGGYGWGYPYYGWGYPYYGGWGYPHYGAWGYPLYTLPTVAAPAAATAPAESADK
jgi:hypothetical protein